MAGSMTKSPTTSSNWTTRIQEVGPARAVEVRFLARLGAGQCGRIAVAGQGKARQEGEREHSHDDLQRKTLRPGGGTHTLILALR